MGDEKWLLKYIKSADGFICPNEYGILKMYDNNMNKFFKDIQILINSKLVRRRDCQGLAYELINMEESK